MGMKWTKEQEKVISLRDRNILVSAAAGSGKTAVLVQRIVSRITDPIHPVDIDQLLIMTFTRAAAGEMKERIAAALERELYENPDNEHLQKQMTLIHTAQITTIDGFCAYVIRNYFHLIGLDPGYRMADEGEAKLLKGDVLKKLLEEYYAKDESKYHQFVECYASGKSDEGLAELILDLYETAMSHPYPQEWLQHCTDGYRMKSIEELKETEWMKLLWTVLSEELREAEKLAEKAREICLESDGPCLYEDAVNSDLRYLKQLKEKVLQEDYQGIYSLLAKPEFARLSAKKAPDVDEKKKEQVKLLREEEKDILKELGARYFQSEEEDLLEIVKACKEPMEMLVEMTLSFIEVFAEQKREKNILDFTDLEHFALEILMTKTGEVCHVSQAARELSQKYEEVLVDEYQDSNLVQEMITNCVSGWAKQKNNVFMVGDVKQSIYRFRLARPELFMEKYKRYTLEDSGEQRIDLGKNFRSRTQVLESVNYIFRQIMGEDLGGVCYDDAAALYPGASFQKGEDPEFVKTQVLLVEKDGEELSEDQSSENAKELEALAIAHQIREMVGKKTVLDAKTGEYRAVEYGDIVILLRTAYGWADTFGEVLAAQGIPVYTASKTGYFSALEVVAVLNYLKICDNPLQDIPLAGVLRSPMVGCTAQELAMLRCETPKGSLYESVCSYLEDGQLELFAGEDEKEKLKAKLRSFLKLLNEVRDRAVFTPVHQLILYILEATGYGNYARALPPGEQRSANLAMLVEKAMDYEKTSYRGLFNFVRYMEQLQKYEIDYGEVNVSGAGVDCVQIMTIHKSKGLEFPIVFVAGMGKQFNFQDLNARLILHPELGLGADAILPEKRIIVPSLNKQLIRRELLKESLGEELRVLYVAMTRAKEKLILTGSTSKLEKQMLTLAGFTGEKNELLPLETRMKAKNYWAFVLPALARHRCMDELYQEYEVQVKGQKKYHQVPVEFVVEKITGVQMTQEEILYQTSGQIKEERLKNWDSDKVYDEEVHKILEERFRFVYPYAYLKDIPVKVSVSELKKRSYAAPEEKEDNLYFEPDIIPLVPAFMEEKEETYQGAARGTAYHRMMECLDYSKVNTKEQIRQQLEDLVSHQKMQQEEAACIVVSDIEGFVQSSIGKRMEKAAGDRRLFREQPFMISVGASEINEAWEGSETVLVQGIIDAYFLEEDELVLVDYKTDKVNKGEEKRLVDLYHIQLEDYARALERMTGKKVKQKYIYSFTLQKEILL